MSITYFVLLILIFIGELYGLLYVLSTKASFDRTYSTYSNDPTIELQGDEWFLKKKFDRMFFTAETECNCKSPLPSLHDWALKGCVCVCVCMC
jgi:hypothetical protein